MQDRNRKIRKLLFAALATAGIILLFATRKVQVLLIENNNPVHAMSARVDVGAAVLKMDTIPPQSLGYVWGSIPAGEATFVTTAMWADGTESRDHGCYVAGGPGLFKMRLGRPADRRCERLAMTPMGAGIVYAEAVCRISRFRGE